MKQIFVVAALLLASTPVTAQPRTHVNEEPVFFTYTNHEVNAKALADSSLYRRRSDWQRIVDQFWGPGLPRSQKQQVFNTFANYIHDIFPGFSGLNINWDSLRAFYTQQINDSTSRGGFSAILSKLAHELRDYHVVGWDTIMQSTPLNPGAPVFVLNLTFSDIRHFGAVLTPLPDSTLLVLRAVANHPLGLQPGDIIRGYEGVPWKRLVFELLESPLPRLGHMAATQSSRIHMLLTAAGMNWHLFDTIDVIRYHSGDLEHLPTAPLSSLDIPAYMPNSEQLAVPSVPQPDYEPVAGSDHVSYGVVQGTNIGYIYISGHGPGVKAEFQNAVFALMGTDGLIIDIRFDAGGFVSQGPEAGLAVLMNYSTQTLVGLERLSPADLYALKPVTSTPLPFFINADPNTLYERPIAVLISPFAISQGDFTAYKFRYLSSARFFGKSINGAVTGMIDEEPVVSGFYFMVPFFVLADHREPNVLLLRKEFPDFEPVWFDRDDVALGDDTIVKRALAWITSVAHTHGVTASRGYYGPGLDSVRLTASVENPQSHAISVVGRFMADTMPVDSTLFVDDGQHGDGAADDGLWGASWSAPAGERFYTVTSRVVDPADLSTFSMPYAARFTTAGPVTCAGYSTIFTDTIPNPGDLVRFVVALKNNGATLTIPDVAARVTPLDSGNIASVAPLAFGTIAPGAVANSTVVLQILFSAGLLGPYDARFALDISSQEVLYWRDTMSVTVTGIEEERTLPVHFSLGQNYPNPFNPTTVIRFQLPVTCPVMLGVYDLLGRHVAELVNERKESGSYKIRFDATGLPSGMYVYRLTAGAFVQSRKMIVVR